MLNKIKVINLPHPKHFFDIARTIFVIHMARL